MELQMKTRPGGEEATLDMIPMRRVSSPDEQARTALWLLSDDASYMTGDCIVVDGGRTI
jgi:meso-butanediol dehydrogenase/(S,S)-butanediol dehydrogenase/diacetyl reductase